MMTSLSWWLLRLYLRTWSKTNSPFFKLPVTVVRKLFLQSPILGFEDNFAFHFNEEGGANLHEICLVLTDYHTLQVSMISACSPSTTIPSTLSSVLKSKVNFVPHFSNVIPFTSPGDLRRSVPRFSFHTGSQFQVGLLETMTHLCSVPFPSRTVAPHSAASPTPGMS